MKAIITLSGYLLCLIVSLMPQFIIAEAPFACGTTVTTFPYNQSFESGNLSDWTVSNSVWRSYSGATPTTDTGPLGAYSGT